MRIGLGAFLAACLLSVGFQAQTDDARRVLSQRAPEYPAILKAKNIGGVVRLEVVITLEGAVRSVGILGGNPALAESAEKAVREWKFSAAPRETKRVVTIQFDPRQ